MCTCKRQKYEKRISARNEHLAKRKKRYTVHQRRESVYICIQLKLVPIRLLNTIQWNLPTNGHIFGPAILSFIERGCLIFGVYTI